jgi:hypothetical protein
VITLAITAVVLVCLFVSALAGMAIRIRLPKDQVVPESLDVIKLAAGLMATLVALILGLLVSSANNFRNTVDGLYRESMVNTLMLDHNLSSYGPEALDARNLLRQAAASRFKTIWPAEDFGPVDPAGPQMPDAVDNMEKLLLQLRPSSEAQTWFRARALESTNTLAQTSRILLGQRAATTLPLPLLAALVAWTSAMFLSFGLLARRNATVIVSLFIAALAVSLAVLVIFELGKPFSGPFRLSSRVAHVVVETLGK